MSSQSELTWAQRASRQKVGRFLQPNKRRLDNPTDVPLVGTVLYEDDDLKGQILASKAMAIIQQSLSSGSVLFTFQKTLFPDRVAAYKVIQDQISPDVEFRPLSLYDSRADGSLLIEARFAQVEHAQVAMREGVTVQGVVYKASTSKESAEFGDVKHVRFTLMRMVDKTTFLSDLMESLSYFGKVLQVKKFTHRGYFEGKLSVILDTSVGFQVGDEWQEAKPLDRMLYLSEFDCFVPATYQGAPPVCHFCQHSGHVRAKCPELARRRCFRCNKQGHMLRFCPEGKQADYLKKRKMADPSEGSQEVQLALDAANTVMRQIDQEKLGLGKEKDEVEEEELDSLVDEDESLQGADSVDASENDKSTNGESFDAQMEDLQGEDYQDKFNGDDDMEEEDEIVLAGSNGVKKLGEVRGSAFSKYASNEVALTMNVDSPEEMMGLTKLKDASQRKRMEVNANLKGAHDAGVKNGNKLGNSGGVSSGTGAKGNKSGVASGVASGGVSGGAFVGVKNSKTDGRAPLKTKQDARRAQ